MSCLLCAVLFSVGAKIFPADLNAGEKSVWENTYLHRRTMDNPNNKSKATTAAEHFLSSPNHNDTAKTSWGKGKVR